MKRLLLLITALFLLASVEGQILIHSNAITPTPPTAIETLLADGHTKAQFIAESQYITEVNDSVSVWADAINDYDLGVTTGSKRKPVFAGDSITFNGSTNCMRNTSLLFSQPIFVYMVFTQLASPTGWEDENMFFGDGSCYLKQNSATPSIMAYSGSPSSTIQGPVIGQRGVVRVLFNGSSSLLQVNEADASTDTDFGTNGITGGFYVGGVTFTATTGYGNFSVMEIIVRDAADDATNQDIIYDYLVAKYL